MTPADHPAVLTKDKTHYCPGCSHGIVERLVAEVIEELDLCSRTIGVAPIGCSILIYDHLLVDFISALHGRAPAVATGIKRMRPDLFVFTYQGDGDIAAIGTAELVHAALRGENITIVFVNNTVYGMTGGQMAPTTLPGQLTTSSPTGRDSAVAGFAVRVAELVSSQDGPAYVARTTVADPKGVMRTKRAIEKAFRAQLLGLGFSLVEVLGACPTGLGLTPVDACAWVRDSMIPHYPLGEFRVHERLAGAALGA